MKQSIYEEVTNNIIAALEKGVKPWDRPWQRKSLGLPKNLKTNKAYRGINILNLWLKAEKEGYLSNKWLTFRQAVDLSHKIKKGEHGARCLYFKICEKEVLDDKTKKTEIIKYPMPKIFSVFNLGQIQEMENEAEPILENPIEKIEQLIKSSGAKIIYGRQAAFFRPSTDEIYMPLPQTFRTQEDYYATLLHEFVHWTGHGNRLNRKNIQTSEISLSYAGEELVAELGSAFLGAEFGIKGEVQHASYINDWLRIMRADKSVIFKAASLAQQAFDYLLSFQDQALH